MTYDLYILPGLSHHKNVKGLELMKPFINIEFIEYDKISVLNKDTSLLIINNLNCEFNEYKTIYGPHLELSTATYGHKNNNKILNLLSTWVMLGAANLNTNARQNDNICYTDSGVTYIALPFPVDIQKFTPMTKNDHCVFHIQFEDSYTYIVNNYQSYDYCYNWFTINCNIDKKHCGVWFIVTDSKFFVFFGFSLKLF